MARCFKDVQQALASSGGSHTAAKKLLQCLQKEAMVMRTQALELSLEGRKEEAVKKLSSAIDRNPTLAEYHVFRCLPAALPISCVPLLRARRLMCHLLMLCTVYVSPIGEVFTVSWVTLTAHRKTSTWLSTSVGCLLITPHSS